MLACVFTLVDALRCRGSSTPHPKMVLLDWPCITIYQAFCRNLILTLIASSFSFNRSLQCTSGTYEHLTMKYLLELFLKNGPSLASFSFIFGLLQTIQNLHQINMLKYPSNIWIQDSNSWTSVYESPPLTTRPGPPPIFIRTWNALVYYYFLF